MASPRVGCAGWSYRDWIGEVYARHLTPDEWLAAYAKLFPVVEIDATFYGLPARATVDGWIASVASQPEFRFCAKMSQEVTHDHLVAGRIEKARSGVQTFLERVVLPLEQAGRHEAVLVQLPPTFAYYGLSGGSATLRALIDVVAPLEPSKRRVAVEFRHGSWFDHVGERLATEVQETLQAEGLSCVRTDGLGLRTHRSRTARWTYFRFHGRRNEIPPSERGLSFAPYNYEYSRDEVAELATEVQESSARDEATLVLFNNTHRGQGARNAFDLMTRLGQRAPIGHLAARPTKLDEFT